MENKHPARGPAALQCGHTISEVDVLKILVSVDMEGISGVVSTAHTERNGHDYELARRLMTMEANAAVEGAFDAGATEVVVSDSHGTFLNLLPDMLDPRAQLASGQPKYQSMFATLDPTYDAVVCVGYHSRAGDPGVHDHTINDAVVADLQINGTPASELMVNAGMAAVHGVPVVMGAGDDTFTRHAEAVIPGIETATVKWHLSRTSARMLSPHAARALIREKTRRGIERRDGIAPLAHSLPVTFRITFRYTVMAEVAAWMPGVQRVDGLTVEYTDDDYLRAFHCARGLIVLGGVYA